MAVFRSRWNERHVYVHSLHVYCLFHDLQMADRRSGAETVLNRRNVQPFPQLSIVLSTTRRAELSKADDVRDSLVAY